MAYPSKKNYHQEDDRHASAERTFRHGLSEDRWNPGRTSFPANLSR
jgi:hypothetical protein